MRAREGRLSFATSPAARRRQSLAIFPMFSSVIYSRRLEECSRLIFRKDTHRRPLKRPTVLFAVARTVIVCYLSRLYLPDIDAVVELAALDRLFMFRNVPGWMTH
jgi:hypothetical protein